MILAFLAAVSVSDMTSGSSMMTLVLISSPEFFLVILVMNHLDLIRFPATKANDDAHLSRTVSNDSHHIVE